MLHDMAKTNNTAALPAGPIVPGTVYNPSETIMLAIIHCDSRQHKMQLNPLTSYISASSPWYQTSGVRYLERMSRLLPIVMARICV